MFDRLFLAHPRSVAESYLEHAAVALGFGLTMILAGLGCIVHAVVPALCTTTGSGTVRRLHARLGARRETATQHAPIEWQHNYEI